MVTSNRFFSVFHRPGAAALLVAAGLIAPVGPAAAQEPVTDEAQASAGAVAAPEPAFAVARASRVPDADAGRTIDGRVSAVAGELQTVFEQRSRGGGGGRSGGGSGGGTAVPRGGGGGGSSAGGGGSRGGSGGGTYTGPRTRSRSGSGGDASGTPTYSRPRDGRNATGEAVQRRPGTGGGGGGGGTTVIVPGRGYWGGLYPWGWGGLGFGGLYGGYWGGWGGGFYDPWWYGGYPAGGWAGGVAYADGGIKLKMKPRQAEVFVDGYFAGRVDDYDGFLQRLRLEPGPHRVEVRLDGYEPLSFEVRIIPDRTISYKGSLKKIGETN